MLCHVVDDKLYLGYWYLWIYGLVVADLMSFEENESLMVNCDSW